MPTVLVHEWPPKELTVLRVGLEELAQLVAAPIDDLSEQERRGWLARLLVVRSCGYLEQAAAWAGKGYLAGRSHGPVLSFGHSWLGRARNPWPEALVLFVGRFDMAWSNELSDILQADDQRLHRELSFLVDRRNRIAHGLNEGIGIVRALALSEVAFEIADWFVLRFNPDRP